MNTKILQVAGLTFALTFVAIFILMWMRSSDILGMSVQEMNSLYTAEYAIDLTLFDGTIVTQATVDNLQEEIDNLRYIYTGLEMDVIGSGETYTASLIENDNGMITKIQFEGR